MSDAESPLRLFHEATLESLQAIVRFHILVQNQLPSEQRPEVLHGEYLVLLR